ncbi:hypothetical protein [Halomicrobium salinisoli]|uniref:hypothetical protein n=1 Tax=Halomicrobium salinisoli TaxID=2878391 RepID=UPI001CEFDB4A|nr:hypothetical protein [Halomicrobium salinisoli]
MSRPTVTRYDGAERCQRRDRTMPPAALFGAGALVPAGVALLLRLLRNAPASPPRAVYGATPAVETLAAVAAGLAFVGLAAVTDRRAERAALAAVGVFAVLGVLDAAAWLPAAAAATVGCAAAVALRARAVVDTPLRRRDRPLVPAALGLLALAASLAGSAGLWTASLRPLGASLAFATAAALPVARSPDAPVGPEPWPWGLVTAGIVLAAASAPFVAGAVALAALGAGSVSLPLLAAGVGGAVSAAAVDLRRGAFGAAVGAALLLFAGAPATLPRAAAFALGLVVLAREWAPPATGSVGRGATRRGETDA